MEFDWSTDVSANSEGEGRGGVTRDLHISTGAGGPDHTDPPGELDPLASSRLHFRELCSVSGLLNLGAYLIVPGIVLCLLGPLKFVGCVAFQDWLDCIVIFLGNTGGLRGVVRALLAHHPEKLPISQEVTT